MTFRMMIMTAALLSGIAAGAEVGHQHLRASPPDPTLRATNTYSQADASADLCGEGSAPYVPVPIIEIPGLLSTSVHATYSDEVFAGHKPENVVAQCHPWGGGTTTQQVWPAVLDMTTKMNCMKFTAPTVYHPATSEFKDPDGMTSTVGKFGFTDTFEKLVDIGHFANELTFHMIEKQAYVFKQLNSALRKCGYVNQKTLFGAPYDFRKVTPHYLESEFIPRMKALVERVFAADGRPVLLIGHSEGCAVGTYFLNSMTNAWKTKYIAEFAMVSPANGGACIAQFGALKGINPAAQCPTLKANEGYWGSIGWRVGLTYMLPTSKIWGDRTVMTSGGTSYTASQFEEAFDAAFPKASQRCNSHDGSDVPTDNYAQMQHSNMCLMKHAWKNVKVPSEEKTTKDPGVSTHVFHTLDLVTPNQFSTEADELDCHVDVPWKDLDCSVVPCGDGTVSNFALTWMEDHWSRAKGTTYRSGGSDDFNHKNLLANPAFFADLKKLIVEVTKRYKLKVPPGQPCKEQTFGSSCPDGQHCDTVSFTCVVGGTLFKR